MTPETSKTSSKPSWVLTLFCAAFFLPGLFVFILPVMDLTHSARANFWKPAQAHILSANLSSQRGDDSTTYRAEGEYSYSWEGISYTSNRLMFGGGYDSQENYHRKIVRELETAKVRSKSVDIWVNPRKPSEAVIDRGVRWVRALVMLVFSSIFMGVGAGVMWVGQAAGKSEVREKDRQKAYPRKPWKWRDDWQTQFIPNNNRIKTGVTLAFTLFWNAMSLPILFIVPGEVLEKNNYLALIALLLPLVGIGFIVWTIKTYRQAKRFKHTGFELETYPAALGYYLRGNLHIATQFSQDTQFNVTLNHIHKYQTGSGKNRRTREDIKWQDEQYIPANAGRWRETYELPIFFKLPAEEHPSDWSDFKNEYIWRLEIRAELDGADYQQDFIVPVFDPKTYPKIIPLDIGEMTAPADVFTYQGDWTKTGVVFNSEGEGTYYYFPPARHKGMALSMTFMALVFGGIGSVGLFTSLPVLITAIFGIVGIFIAYGAVNFWMYKSAVNITNSEVTLRRGLLRGGFQVFQSSQFNALKLTEAMQMGNKKVYNIVGHLTSGKKVKLAKYFLRKRDAENLLSRMSEEMNVSPAKS